MALQATVVKASKVLSAQLAENEKLTVPAGARLSALVAGEDSDYWLVREAAVDGVPVAILRGYIFKAHWKIEESGEDAGLSAQARGEPASAFACYAENRAKHRRLYAAFRRRLSR